jgi:hypothetical protein
MHRGPLTVGALLAAGAAIAMGLLASGNGAGKQENGPTRHLTARDREGLRRIIETPIAP